MATPPVDQSSAAARTQSAPRRSSDILPARPRRRVSCGSPIEACTATSVAGLRSGAARRSFGFSRLLRHGGCSRQAVSMQRHAALRALALLVVMAAASSHAFGFTCDPASPYISFNPCVSDTCDPTNPAADPQGFVHTPVDDGTPCDDGSECTTNDSCQQGACRGGMEVEGPCDDGNPCTANDACVAGSCIGDPLQLESAPCDDKNPSTKDGGCQGGTCPADLLDGTTCDDGNPCTDTDTCLDGFCAGSIVKDGTICNDDNPCTTGDTCLDGFCGGGLEPDGTACDDANPCTANDSCQQGACTGGVPDPAGTVCAD